MSTLLEIAKKYNTDKEWSHNYISGFYEELFSPYREKNITFVELGVQNGYSMQTWREYFSNAKLIGIDVDSNETTKNLDNTELLIGDGYSFEVCEKVPNADIMIDDGPHHLPFQCKFLSLYLPKLNKGGVLCIEDIYDLGAESHYPSGSMLDIFSSWDEIVNVISSLSNKKFETGFVRTNNVIDSQIYFVKRID